MRRKFGWIVTCAVVLFFTSIAASSLFACSESCLDEFPCNVPADDPDGSYDGATHVPIDATADATGDVESSDAEVADAIDDMSTIEDAQAGDGDAADD